MEEKKEETKKGEEGGQEDKNADVIRSILEKAKKKHKKGHHKKHHPSKHHTSKHAPKDDGKAGGDEVKSHPQSHQHFPSSRHIQFQENGPTYYGTPVPSQVSVVPNLNKRRKTDPTVSGYVYVPEFANEVVEDPTEIHTWVQTMTKRLYIVWVFYVLCACFLAGLTIQMFHVTPKILAIDVLFRIFLWGRWNYLGLAGFILSLLVLANWGSIMLTHPFPKRCITRYGRWLICHLLILYMGYCIGTQAVECQNLKEDLRILMVADLQHARKNPNPAHSKDLGKINRLADHTQPYFECCGMNKHTDWHTIAHHPTIPATCCNEREYPGCYTKEEEIQKYFWKAPCLEAEYIYVIVMAAITFSVEVICFIGAIISSVLLRVVIKHTNQYDVDHVHPFT